MGQEKKNFHYEAGEANFFVGIRDWANFLEVRSKEWREATAEIIWRPLDKAVFLRW